MLIVDGKSKARISVDYIEKTGLIRMRFLHSLELETIHSSDIYI